MEKVSDAKQQEIVKPFVKLRASQDQDAQMPAEVKSQGNDERKAKGDAAPPPKVTDSMKLKQLLDDMEKQVQD